MPIPRAEFAGWILESLTTGVVAIDDRGAVTALNAGARRILGLSGSDSTTCLGRDCRELLAAEPTVARLLLEALGGRTSLSRAELVLRGDVQRAATTIGFTLGPVNDRDDAVRGAVMIFRDLTAFERADEQDRLRERLAALGEMAAGLAHEIRNPLAGMEVLAGLLKRRLGDRPDEQELLSELTAELHELADTVSASLEFVRPLVPERTSLDPVALVEGALRVARSRVAFEGRVERAYAEPLPACVGDAEQLRAVVTNLIVNAFEAMVGEGSAPGRLRLTLGTDRRDAPRRALRVGPDGATASGEPAPSRELVIGVADSGPGVEAGLRERIFYPFFTTKESGSGVGLAMAQKVAASHGGVVELRQPSGGGAVFQLRLPLDGGAS